MNNVESLPFVLSIKEKTTSVVELAKQNFPSSLRIFSDTPEDYPDKIKLELVEFFDTSKIWIPGDDILSKSKSLHCEGGKILAGLLYDNQDQIPQDCERYILTFAGTVWTPDFAKSRGVTTLSKGPSEGWEIGFAPIDTLNSPHGARFVRVIS